MPTRCFGICTPLKATQENLDSVRHVLIALLREHGRDTKRDWPLIKVAAQNPNFLTAVVGASGGRVVPAPGGVLIRDVGGVVLGAVGISGDVGDNDEICAVAGVEAAGLRADPGGRKK